MNVLLVRVKISSQKKSIIFVHGRIMFKYKRSLLMVEMPYINAA